MAVSIIIIIINMPYFLFKFVNYFLWFQIKLKISIKRQF